MRSRRSISTILRRVPGSIVPVLTASVMEAGFSWLVLVMSSGMAADPQPSGPAPVHWVAPEGCPTASEVDAWMLRTSGGHPRGGDELDMSVRAEIVRHEDPPRFRLTLVTTFAGNVEEHILESADCRLLAESVVLFAAALDEGEGASAGALREGASELPSVVVEARPWGGSSKEPTENWGSVSATVDDRDGLDSGETLRPGEAVEGADVELRTAGPAWPSMGALRPTWELAMVAGLDVGSIEVPAAILTASAGPVWRRWRVEAVARFVVPRTIERRGFRGVFWQWAVAPRACLRLLARRVEFPVCGSLEVGQVYGRTRDVAPVRAGEHVWVAPFVGTGVVWRGPWAGVRAELEGGVRLVGGNFAVDGSPMLTPWPVSLRASLGFFLPLDQGLPSGRTTRRR